MNFIAASGDTVPSADGALRSPVRVRVLSALVLAPVAVACVWFGRPWFDLMVATAALAMAWEWRRICAGNVFGSAGAALMATVAAILVLTALDRPWAAFGVLLVGTMFVGLLARSTRGTVWCMLGVAAVGLPSASLIWLRTGEGGQGMVLWLLGAVIATDTFAYIAGRAVGGPRLAPRISPKKTWAGLAGGMAAAAIWTLAFGWWMGWTSPVRLLLAGAAAAVAAQIGDLAISVVKRRFGVKDSSHLIPGHGGVLDRADGFVLTAPVMAALVALGVDGTSWQ
jgi:phosphatidate cytidylyltransferase